MENQYKSINLVAPKEQDNEQVNKYPATATAPTRGITPDMDAGQRTGTSDGTVEGRNPASQDTATSGGSKPALLPNEGTGSVKGSSIGMPTESDSTGRGDGSGQGSDAVFGLTVRQDIDGRNNLTKWECRQLQIKNQDSQEKS